MYRAEIKEADKPIKARWLLCQSDSPEDIYSFIEGNRVWAPGGNSEIEGQEGDGWANTKDLKAAIRLGRYGWAEGRKLMIDEFDNAAVIRRALPRKHEMLDVAGAYPMVPLAVAGDPCCMVSSGLDSVRTKPVVRIVVNVAVSGAVTAATILRRGAAILSWVDSLEAAGIRCEIEIIEAGLFREFDPVKLGVLFTITGKRSHEHLDVDRLGFLLSHPSVQRRLGFALYEREAMQAKLGLTQDEAITYGAPTDAIPPDFLGPHSIYFPAMLRLSPDWASPATAVAAVERFVQKALQVEGVAEDQAWGMAE